MNDFELIGPNLYLQTLNTTIDPLISWIDQILKPEHKDVTQTQ